MSFPPRSLPRRVLLAAGLFGCFAYLPLRAAEPTESTAVKALAEPQATGRVEPKDPRFDKLVPPGAKVEKLAEGVKWAEGPVWVSDSDGKGGHLLFSDVPNNVIYRWKDGEGIKEFMRPSGYTGKTPRGGEPGSNGLTLDPEGRLCMCEHGDRRVTRVEKDGSKTVLADRFEGKRFNSPNDLVFDSKGNLFFTDPPYGLEGNMKDPKKELPFQGVFRLSKDGKLTAVIKDLTFPNGLALSPDEKTLYVAVSDPAKAVWMAYDLKEDGTVANGRVFFDSTSLTKDRKGLPDGMKVDREGNLWASGPGGIFVFAPDATVLGMIAFDVPTANCAWAGDGSTLYITSNHDLCRLKTRAKGNLPGKK